MINSGNYNWNYAHSFFGKYFLSKFKNKSDQEGEKTHILLKTAGLNNYKYNYAHSFFGKDFKHLNV